MRKINLVPCLLALCVSACLTNVPEPDIGGIYACEVQEDCPGSQICLQKTCETIELPAIQIMNPEDGKDYTFGMGPHQELLTIVGNNLTLRPLAESNDAVPGEGHLVVFVDGEQVAMIDTGDLTGGVPMAITIPDEPGVHRIHVQARLNDETNYDTEGAVARTLVWVADGNKHVALRVPWPGDEFPLDAMPLNAEVAVFPADAVAIGPPMTGLNHVHVYYSRTFPDCLEDFMCYNDYEGVVPEDDNDFGPVFLPSAGAGPATLTAVIMLADHDIYYDPVTMLPVYSSIDILRTNQE
jgi:hypothetical protein